MKNEVSEKYNQFKCFTLVYFPVIVFTEKDKIETL